MTATLETTLSIALLTPMDHPGDPMCRWGAPILFWGSPGIGKSGRIGQVSAACDLHMETLYLSTLQPEDISGIPMEDKETGGARRVCDLPQILNLIKLQRGVLLLDELSCARPAVQGASLGLVYERTIAGKRLPGGIRVVSAANPPEEAAGGWVPPPPTVNRFMHIDVPVPEISEWVSWLLHGSQTNVVPIAQGEAVVLNGWENVWPRIAGLGAGFMNRHNDKKKLYNLPKEGARDRGRAWPSPRSWEAALRAVATAEILGMKDNGIDMLIASVGLGLAAEWAEWVAYANLPDPKDVLENGWRADKRRLDIAFAVYSSAIAFALNKTDEAARRKYAILAWNLLEQAVKDNLGDIALAPAGALTNAGYVMRAGPDVAAACKVVLSHLGTTGIINHQRKA